MNSSRVLMAVLAHPDDETFIGGTLARYAAEGVRVVLVSGTGGEVGEISDPSLATPETLGAVRAREHEESARALGIARLARLGYRDSGMAGTADNNHPASFHQADLAEAVGRLVAIIRAERPAVIICPNEQGDYGHPDHVKAHRVATAAFDAASDATRYPAAGPAWAPAKLYYTAISRSTMEAFARTMRDLGIEDPPAERPMVDIEGNPVEFGTPDELITTEIEVSAYAKAKRASALAHRTQFGPDHFLRRAPIALFREHWSREQFRRIRGPSGAPNGQRESDLFGGIG